MTKDYLHNANVLKLKASGLKCLNKIEEAKTLYWEAIILTKKHIEDYPQSKSCYMREVVLLKRQIDNMKASIESIKDWIYIQTNPQIEKEYNKIKVKDSK